MAQASSAEPSITGSGATPINWRSDADNDGWSAADLVGAGAYGVGPRSIRAENAAERSSSETPESSIPGDGSSDVSAIRTTRAWGRAGIAPRRCGFGSALDDGLELFF